MQDKYPKRKAELVVIALFLITLTEIFYYWYSYHPMANAQEWLQNPSFAEYIKKDKIQGRVMTPRGGVDRADIYRKHGWDKAEDFYVFSRNEMLPNLSTTWGIPQLQAYTGLSNLKRHNLFEAVLEFTSVNLNKTRPDVLLDMAHVGYVIVSNKEDQPFKNMKLVKQIESHKKYDKSLLLYENPHVVPRARVVTQYHVVKTTNDLVNKFLTMDESLLQTVLLEEKVSIKSQESAEQAKVTWLADRNQYIQLEVDAPTDGILVLADMYEENWKAYDNGKEVKILPANLIQRAIVLPKGKHEVEFKYEPQSFYKGRNISIASHIIVLAGLAYFGAQSWRASRPKR